MWLDSSQMPIPLNWKHKNSMEPETEHSSWLPLPGPQSMAFFSEADELFYGGAAGGGKSDLLLGVAWREHTRSIIFRRVYPSLNALVERSKAVYASFGTYNENKYHWKFGKCGRLGRFGKFDEGRILRFASVQHEKNKADYQGQPHDFYGFDEITEFSESMYRFITGWNRSAVIGQRCRIVCTGNPPTSAEGDWVMAYWRPWLDPSHPNPAKPGELRWFTTIGGEDIEFANGAPIEVCGEEVLPRSRTFIPARVQDNPYLVKSGYIARLQALPEPLRSKMLYGDFTKGREDNPYQVIPSEWARLAQERWKKTDVPNVPMTAMGVDVARGGGDKTVLAMRYGYWLDELISYPGTSTPDGPAVAGLALGHNKDGATIYVDVVGVGASVYDCLKSNVKGVVPINGSSASSETDKSGQLRFVNLRAELWWKLREALDPSNGQGICLPPDRELLSDLCAPTWRLTPRGVQIEGKDDLSKRIGRSPDKGDAVVYAFGRSSCPGMGLLEWARSKVES